MTTFEYNRLISMGRLKKGISTCFIVLFLIVVPAAARRSAKGPVKLTIYPAKTGEAEQKYQLIVKAEDQIDGDAVPLYEKAVKLIPKNFNQKQIEVWLNLPVEQFPQQQAEETLRKYLEPLKLAVRATRCKECNWPELKPGEELGDLSVYRRLAYILGLWARLEISRGGYEGAAIAMRTAFVMARDMEQAPTIIHALFGVDVGRVMCRELEQFVQAKDSPNLYQALADIPRPLVDVEKSIEIEKKVDLSSVTNEFEREQIVKRNESSFNRIRLISKQLVNELNGLQIVEALKLYAATHDGQLPERLNDISRMEIPKDVMSGNAFEYRRTSQGAVLKSAMTEEGGPKYMVNYVIVLKK